MEFNEREVEFPNRKNITKISENGDEITIDMEKAEGDVLNNKHGTGLTAEILSKANWRDDKSISFKKLETDELPNAITETQIVTKLDGTSWVIPPIGLGEPKQVGVDARAISQSELAINIANEANASANNAEQVAIEAREEVNTFVSAGVGTVVKINSQSQNVVNFDSDPQTQINSLIANTSQIDNTSDLDKPISTAVQSALNDKQHTLVSGTSIKTIAGQTLLGSGNIPVGSIIYRGDLPNSFDFSVSNSIASLASGIWWCPNTGVNRPGGEAWGFLHIIRQKEQSAGETAAVWYTQGNGAIYRTGTNNNIPTATLVWHKIVYEAGDVNFNNINVTGNINFL